MGKADRHCMICGKEIPEEGSRKCKEECWNLLEDTEVIEVQTPGTKYYFYQSPRGDFFHMIWPDGIDSWNVMPVPPTEYDKKIKEASKPGYWYESTTISETPLDQIDEVDMVDTCTR